jgi:hypothetical protein
MVIAFVALFGAYGAMGTENAALSLSLIVHPCISRPQPLPHNLLLSQLHSAYTLKIQTVLYSETLETISQKTRCHNSEEHSVKNCVILRVILGGCHSFIQALLNFL